MELECFEEGLESPETPDSQDSQNTVDLSLQQINFDSDIEVQAMLKALSGPGRTKVVKKMSKLPARRFMKLLLIHKLVRSHLAANLDKVSPSGILASMVVQRKVFNNPSMASTSVKYFGVCSFWPTKIASFVYETLIKTMGVTASTAKVLVVVEGAMLSKDVAEKLNSFGYAVHTAVTPSQKLRVYLHLLQNWPTFLVTSDVFSGLALCRVDAAFVFRNKHELLAHTALERQLALTAGSVSALVTPATEQGLFYLADHYSDFKFYLPIRV